MDVDLSRLPTGTAGWRALVDHALALGDLAEVDWFELKGALPFTSKPDRKRSAVVLARAILGMANRMPDVADTHLGGYGVVLVGITGRDVIGAEQVDGAVLRDALEPYVGRDGPRWDHVFIDHADGLVMAVVVDPPLWGDSIHTFRKDYLPDENDYAIRDGGIFMRLPGKTRQATSHDIAELQRRRDKSPSTGAQVSIGYTDTFDRVDTSSVADIVEEAVHSQARDLLDGLPAENPLGIHYARISVNETRSQDQFIEEVEGWRSESLERRDAVADEFLRYELARGQFVIHNDSDRYLESVRAQLQFPSDVRVLAASETDYCDHGGSFRTLSLMPDPPDKWESGSSLTRLIRSGPYMPQISMPSVAPMPSMEIQVAQSDDGFIVTWHVGDLRPRSREVSDEKFAVVTDAHLNVVPVQCRITARGVDYVFEDEVHLSCRQPVNEHLLWRNQATADD